MAIQICEPGGLRKKNAILKKIKLELNKAKVRKMYISLFYRRHVRYDLLGARSVSIIYPFIWFKPDLSGLNHWLINEFFVKQNPFPRHTFSSSDPT